jgi:hypothetical protein
MRDRFTPALIASVMVLVLAVGVGVAEGTLRIKNDRIKNGTLKNALFKTGNINGNKLKNDTVTGQQVLESSLGQVPSAASAASAAAADAVDGVSAGRFNIGGTNVGATQLLSLDGLVLTGSCAAGAPSFSANTTVNNARLWSFSANAATAAGATDPHNEANDVDFDSGDTEDLLPDSKSNEVGELRYIRQPGEPVVTVAWMTSNDANGGCLVAGTANSG